MTTSRRRSAAEGSRWVQCSRRGSSMRWVSRLRRLAIPGFTVRPSRTITRRRCRTRPGRRRRRRSSGRSEGTAHECGLPGPWSGLSPGMVEIRAQLGPLHRAEGVGAVDHGGELAGHDLAQRGVALGPFGVEADHEPLIVRDAYLFDLQVVPNMLVAALPEQRGGGGLPPNPSGASRAAALAVDAAARGWADEAARHRRLADRLDQLITRAGTNDRHPLRHEPAADPTTDPSADAARVRAACEAWPAPARTSPSPPSPPKPAAAAPPATAAATSARSSTATAPGTASCSPSPGWPTASTTSPKPSTPSPQKSAGKKKKSARSNAAKQHHLPGQRESRPPISRIIEEQQVDSRSSRFATCQNTPSPDFADE